MNILSEFVRKDGFTEFMRTSSPEPHRARRRQILSAHPEIRELMGPYRWTFAWIAGLVFAEFAAAFLLRNASGLVILLFAFAFGAFVHHALFVLIHECVHNLVFSTARWNKLAALVANLPIVFPLATGFRQYHLVHHGHKGDPSRDGDIPLEAEARWVGHSPIRKTIWLTFFFVVEGVLRPRKFTRRVSPGQTWARENLLLQGSAFVALALFVPRAELYLFLSTFFAFGLHPLGGRWIQEHFVMDPSQETYSYYGPLNRLMFNAGFHHEHHDVPNVPWLFLPEIRRLAPEFYDDLIHHDSYLKLIWAFIRYPAFNLNCRVIRDPAEDAISAPRSGELRFPGFDPASDQEARGSPPRDRRPGPAASL